MGLFAKTPAKLGSDNDPIRQALFACQTMKELLQRTKLDGTPTPFQGIADAAMLASEGKNEEAKARLHEVLAITDLETRTQLWVWSALRELGEQPDARSSYEILGVVLEVPMRGAYDTLAAYQDGSARYLNFSGSAVFWDAADARIKVLCQSLIRSSVSAASRAKPRIAVSLPKAGTQATLLTRSGMYVISDPPEEVMKTGAALMLELIRRTREKNQ